ncbi:unnamed protein product, partial [Rotaria sp. Silwood1]
STSNPVEYPSLRLFQPSSKRKRTEDKEQKPTTSGQSIIDSDQSDDDDDETKPKETREQRREQVELIFNRICERMQARTPNDQLKKALEDPSQIKSYFYNTSSSKTASDKSELKIELVEQYFDLRARSVNAHKFKLIFNKQLKIGGGICHSLQKTAVARAYEILKTITRDTPRENVIIKKTHDGLWKAVVKPIPCVEYLLTATRKLTIDELHQHAQDARLLYHEFWTIPTNHLEKVRICGAGTKNRYGTIITSEHSRVKLSELPGNPLSTYINANYVNGYSNEYHAFIATQGPLANTIINFYRMIWQEHVPVIVMITRLFEKNKAKCERYIPDSQAIQYGPFQVQIKSISYQTDYEIRRLIIEFENEQREVEQLLVYNDGIGLTGCFIALSNGIKQLDNEHIIDIVRILCELRRDCCGMVQTNDQYQFVYQALSEYTRTLQLSS